ncbi:TTK protein kinase [Phytophthora cinnamomi]|uniref:TTK protein kinase n=1 Tax=Phytophthora cinnamomi TaxID=4785 RepID=UPI0035593848|nr:TTK protein kinase [Phytophthora cinnamomi]
MALGGGDDAPARGGRKRPRDAAWHLPTRRKIKMEPPDDKENQPPSAASAFPASSSSSSSSAVSALMQQLPAPTARYADAQGRLTQILHFGESARSIFMLERASERRLRLVVALKDAPRSVERWLALLRCPLAGNPGKYNKLRLLRRAVTCVDCEAARQTAGYTEMCIMLAKLSETEAGVRQNFVEMKKRRVGVQQPLLYEEEAAFEYAAGKGGNTEAAEEILERGVDNDALTPAHKDELLKKVVAGRAGWVAAFSGSPQEQKVLALRTKMQARRKAQDFGRVEDGLGARSSAKMATTPTPGGLSSHVSTPLQPSAAQADRTPIGQSRGRDELAPTPQLTPSNVTNASNATPVSQTRPEVGFSTVSKVPRTGNKSPLLTTPSLPTRSCLKSQSTSRKTHHPPLRFSTLGGPLRVIASNGYQSDDDDDDDAMMGSQATPAEFSKAMTPIKEVAQNTHNPSAIKSGTKANQRYKSFPGLRYNGILKPTFKNVPNPRYKSLRYLSCGVPAAPTDVPVFKSKSPAPDHKYSPQSQKPVDMMYGSRVLKKDSTARALNHYRSPKRLQLDSNVAIDMSSPSSVSSSSSPPVAAMTSSSSRDALESLTSRVVVNGQKYIKLEQIGSGGSSKVYRMLGPDLKIYALKKIKLKKLDAQSIAQFTNEINLLKKLQGNPHIIKLIAAEQDLKQRQINVIMEHGEIDLSERLRNLKGGMDENLLRVIWTQMLEAVDAIHSQRIIHGDLKPANFLFVNGALKLIDFGIAKTISNDTTNIERDSQVGTVNYMSPEAIQGNTMPDGKRDPEGKMKVGRASDIWSLGCILYQIVYSRPPFADAHNIIEKFRCIIDPSVPIPFPALNNTDLEDVIRSCLQRDHRRRPPITGEGGLLSHPFLRSVGSSTTVPSAPTVTLANAPQVLAQLGDLLRSQGVTTSRVNMFMSIGQAGLGASTGENSQTHRYLYNTQERRTDI